jgi:hypothetical protein
LERVRRRHRGIRHLLDDLTARLDEAARHPDFEITPIETLARRIAGDMGLSGDFALSVCEAPTSKPHAADTG